MLKYDFTSALLVPLEVIMMSTLNSVPTALAGPSGSFRLQSFLTRIQCPTQN
jgi:hypothetical protein